MPYGFEFVDRSTMVNANTGSAVTPGRRISASLLFAIVAPLMLVLLIAVSLIVAGV